MTCANLYPLDANHHHLEFVPQPDDPLPVTELPVVELMEDFGGVPVEPVLGGDAAFEVDGDQLKDCFPFLIDTCEVVAVPPPDQAGVLQGQDPMDLFSPFNAG